MTLYFCRRRHFGSRKGNGRPTESVHIARYPNSFPLASSPIIIAAGTDSAARHIDHLEEPEPILAV
jgi:hypothetical protein